MIGGGGYDEVSMSSIEDAKRTIAFDSGLALIGSIVSEMPLQYWNAPMGDTDRKQVAAPKWLESPSGDGFDINDWAYQAVISLVARGNLFLRVLDTRGDTITQADILNPDRVRAPYEARATDSRIPEGAAWLVDGAPDPAVRHWRSEPIPGTLMAPSLIETHAIALRLPQTALRFGAQWFTEGAHPSSLLVNEFADATSMTDKQATTIKERFIASTRGRREPVVLGRGWKYQQLSVSAEESQFLATLGYSQAEVARMFGPGVAEILGYSSTGGGGLTYSNLESRAAHLLVFGVGKWIARVERVIRSMCPRGVWPTYNRDTIVNSTPQQLYKNLSVALAARMMVPNEARAKIGLPPVAWGDEPNPTPGANVTNSNEDDLPPGADPEDQEDPKDEGGSK